MKLKVYQQGGGLIYTPFIPEQQSTTSTTTSRSKSSDSDEDAKLDPLDKELLGLMKDQNLLPSDIQMIYNRLIQFQRKTQSLSNLTGFGGTDSYRSVMPGMLQIMNLVSQAKYNKASDDEILNQMMSENAGNEFALDGYGRMYVQDKDGKIKKIKPDDFDSEKHSPLSNSQLLYLRERNPELAFDTDIFEDMRNMVGMTSVSKEIDRIIKEFGTEEGQQYVSKAAAQAFLDLNSPDGIYKYTVKGPSSGLKEACDTIWDQLPINMQNLLKIRAAVSGTDHKTFIQDIVLHNITKSQNIDYDSTQSKAAGFSVGGSGDGGDEKNLTEYGYIENLATGRNFELPKHTTFNPTSTVSLHAAIQNTGAIMKKDGITPVGPGMVDAIFENVEGLKQISPQYTVTFGDQLLDETAQGQLLYDGSALQRVKLPYTEVNGEITVNWKLIEEIENANKQIQEKGATPGMIQELISNNPELIYNQQTGLIESVNNMWFLTFGAMIGHDFVDGLDVNSKYLERMSKEKENFWHKKYEEAANYGFVQHDKNAPKRTNAPTDKGFLGFDWSTTRYYHGNVFVPILNELAGATQFYSKNNHLNNAQTKAMNDRDNQIQQEVNSGIRKLNW